ncbi:GntR family transcriptional regulator [Dellaglioa sp. L3N]
MKYIKVATYIKEKINNGEYSYGKKMPTIAELSATLEVSTMTVKKALDLLSSQGYIERRRGSGIFVKMNADSKKKRIPLTGNSSRFPQGKLETKVLKFGVNNPSSEVANKLQIKTTDFIYTVQRVRLLNNKPTIMEYVHMPIDIVPGINMDILENSIYDYIRNNLNRKISSSDFEITGVRPNDEEKDILKLDDSSFLMQITQTVYFDDGTAFEYSVNKHLPEEFAYASVTTDFI